MRSMATIIVLALAALSPSWAQAQSKAVEDCVLRGVSYFKEIGSYPTLSSAPNKGRKAEVVARERCNRTTTAF
jgi:hypothetical protein